MKRALFGVAGNPPNFWASEFKRERANAPQWLKGIGLDALEIQCGYGVRMPNDRAEAFLLNSRTYSIQLSIHGPYYINLGTSDEKKQNNSIQELIKSINLAQKVGAERVIFHPGGIENDRESSRKRAIQILMRLKDLVDFGPIRLYPEIAGKIGQLGSLEDIIEICQRVEYAYPCLDLAHLHARTQGSLEHLEDYERLFETIQRELGIPALQNLHVHFYPVEWGSGGEVRHKAFNDEIPREVQPDMFVSSDHRTNYYLPRYENFISVMTGRGLRPTIICEARDSQDLGALEMKKYYLSLLK